MHGDFSRSTFDPHKHYRGVRLQQGRVQLDADWNEQIDIINHYLDAQLSDTLGPNGAPQTNAGFAITLEAGAAEVEAESVQRRGQAEDETRPPNFQIGAGHYYVDGILCENEAPVCFTHQPHHPGAALIPHKAEVYLIYLDVWQHGVTAHEDPGLRETALNGLDTTTRVQTLWQVKLLPIRNLPTSDIADPGHTHIDELPEWRGLINRSGERACLAVQRQSWAAGLENLLYRVEIHRVHGKTATFKWSRDNGSNVFELDAIQAVGTQNGTTQVALTLKDLGRDQTQLHQGDWVEWLDADTTLEGHSGPLFQVSEPPDYTRLQITLQGKTQPPTSAQRVLLRRWDQKGSATIELVDGALPIQSETWLELEAGIQVRFSAGTFHAGDYWLIPARAAIGDVEWPRQDGQPLERPPDGHLHHYSPLAYLHCRDDEWHVARDLRSIFESLPLLTHKSEQAQRQIKELQATLQRLGTTVETEEHEEEIREEHGAHLAEEFVAQDDSEVSDVVSLQPEHKHIAKTHEKNERLVIGVVAARKGSTARVILYGRARCKVVGSIEPGDLLVPSDRPGCARKGGLYLRPGTMIGKALSGHHPANAHDIGLIDSLITIG